MTTAERELYDAVEEYISTTYYNAAQDQRSAVGFVMTIYRRRLASSFYALKQTLNKRLVDEQFSLTDEDLSQDEQDDEIMDVEEAAEAAAGDWRARSVRASWGCSRGSPSSGPTRRSNRSDAAAEGLNFQTCGVVINLDLPWNPMKVEQRIGRIDRIGQKYPVIRVVNFAYEDTVEADVYFALGQRINLFQGIVGKLQPILSRLPREFEKVALELPEHREAARQRFLADVEGMVDKADEGGFDVDEVADEALDVPDLPEPALTLSDIDAALNRPGVLPQGAQWVRLDPGSYKLLVPGASGPVRVTTSAEVFDDHFESHEFLSPGGALFETLAGPSIDGGAAPGDVPGHCWLVEADQDAHSCEMIVLTPDGVTRVHSLGELIDQPRPTSPLRAFSTSRATARSESIALPDPGGSRARQGTRGGETAFLSPRHLGPGFRRPALVFLTIQAARPRRQSRGGGLHLHLPHDRCQLTRQAGRVLQAGLPTPRQVRYVVRASPNRTASSRSGASVWPRQSQAATAWAR